MPTRGVYEIPEVIFNKPEGLLNITEGISVYTPGRHGNK